MTPARKLLGVVAAICLFLIAGFWFPPFNVVALAANLGIVAIAAFDALRMNRPAVIEIERQVSEVLSVGTPNPVTLRVFNHSNASLELELQDDTPQPSETRGLPIRVEVPAKREVEAHYHLVPQQRGAAELQFVFFRYSSPWGFWTRFAKRRVSSPIRIYPDIRTVGRLELLGRRNRLSELGLKLWRLKGREGEFERLREYRRGDEIRQIDWNATAKNQKLISREFTVERNQNIIILLDCGRSMFNETDGISHLDRALNASINLSYVALSQGDNVHLTAFSDRIERVAGPLRGKRAIQRLIHKTYDLEARLETSDYGLACEDLIQRHRKRALVLLVTYALDEQHLSSISRYLSGVSSSHLFLCVFLKDLPLAELAGQVPKGEVEAHQVGAAAQMLAAQARRIRELKDRGLHVTEVMPNELAAKIINQYLDVKARHLL